MDTTQLDSPAIKSVAELTRKSIKAEVQQIGPPELGQFLISDGSGREIVEMLPELPPRTTSVLSLVAFAKAVAHYGQAGKTSIYYNPSGLIAVLDDSERRRSKIVMGFHKTPEWALLEGFKNNTQYDQQSLIRLFRLRLAHACPAAGNVVASIRKVRFQSTQAIESEQQRGRESMGREITKELAQADLVPEKVTLQVRPFLETGSRDGLVDIECLLDINLTEQKFALLPTPGAMEEIIDAELDGIENDLSAMLSGESTASFPIFYGTP